jgi:hypothetical protein
LPKKTIIQILICSEILQMKPMLLVLTILLFSTQALAQLFTKAEVGLAGGGIVVGYQFARVNPYLSLIVNGVYSKTKTDSSTDIGLVLNNTVAAGVEIQIRNDEYTVYIPIEVAPNRESKSASNLKYAFETNTGVGFEKSLSSKFVVGGKMCLVFKFSHFENSESTQAAYSSTLVDCTLNPSIYVKLLLKRRVKGVI